MKIYTEVFAPDSLCQRNVKLTVELKFSALAEQVLEYIVNYLKDILAAGTSLKLKLKA